MFAEGNRQSRREATLTLTERRLLFFSCFFFSKTWVKVNLIHNGKMIFEYDEVVDIQFTTDAPRQLRDKKLVLCLGLIKRVLEFTPEQKDEESKGVPQKELDRHEGIKKLRDMSRSLITWGSDDALKKWINYIVKIRGENKDIKEGSFDIRHPDIVERSLDPKVETILAIRKELGHKNKGISKDDIPTIDIAYIEELRKSRQNK